MLMDSGEAQKSRKEIFRQIFENIYRGLEGLKGSVAEDHLPVLTDVTSQIRTLDEYVKDLIAEKGTRGSEISLVDQNDLPKTDWQLLGQGSFGVVFKVQFQGNDSAIKIFTKDASSKLQELDTETSLLKGLSHDNVIAYRGTGYVSAEFLKKRLPRVFDIEESPDRTRFLIMEYIERNLDTYVEARKTPDSPGLPPLETWNIGQKIANALSYLHGKGIVHRDLKPDNILYDPGKKILKVADFGLAWSNEFVNMKYVLGSSGSMRGTSTSRTGYRNIRWSAPELFEDSSTKDRSQEASVDRYKRGDIWCYGMIVAYMITGQKPFATMQTDNIMRDEYVEGAGVNIIQLPHYLHPQLRHIVNSCRQIKPEDRPAASKLLQQFDKEMKDKFMMAPEEKEFFSCGFMEKTDIFVADSCVSELTEGYFTTNVRPQGYSHDFLLCPVKTKDAPYHTIPDPIEEWDHQETYRPKFAIFKTKANNKEIDDNPFIALKSLTIHRPGAEEIQSLELSFVQSTYCHHRAMREIWMKELNPEDKHREVPCKAVVNPYYSTSFGLHIAILTNEGPGNHQKFIFCRRARKAGVSSPGALTCGPVESCSINDFVDTEDGSEKQVDLVKTAARGIHEELGLELTGNELGAITLNTVYLKFDTHEWGMCGFVDLTDERISQRHSISANNLEDRFLAGARDKFEHGSIVKVDFTLEAMVDFVFEKHHEFASSAKLVVVKVLQAFFGVDTVQKTFEMKSE